MVGAGMSFRANRSGAEAQEVRRATCHLGSTRLAASFTALARIVLVGFGQINALMKRLQNVTPPFRRSPVVNI